MRQLHITNDQGKDTCVNFAGKGHETYQEVKGERTDFDDFKIVKELLTELNK